MSEPVFNVPITSQFGNVGRYAAPTLVDIDGDGDLDAFVGESGGDIEFFENLGSASNPGFFYGGRSPFGLSNSSRTYYTSPTFVDIDDDGDLDAFIGKYNGNTHFFENMGTASSPGFIFAGWNPFGLSDVGYNAKPTFVDIDGDGDLDALIGNNSGNTLFFENTGTASSPSFAAASTNPFGLSDVNTYASPTFADIDSDGDLDAFIGNEDGDTQFFRNIGTTSSPVFATPNTNPFGLSDVGSYAAPTLVDIDADGDLDAFIGKKDGYSLFFLNASPVSINIIQSDGATAVTEGGTTDSYNIVLSGAAPTADVSITLDNTNQQVTSDVNTLIFTPANWITPQTVTITAVDDTIGEGNHTGLIHHTVSSTDTSFNSISVDSVTTSITDNDLPVGDPVFTLTATNPFGLSDVGSFSSPTFVDIDSDGDLDAFIGSDSGDTLFSENTGTPSNPVFAAASINPFGLSFVDYIAKPTFVDLDGDGDLDALIGDGFGDSMFFENTGTGINPVFAASVTNPFGLSNVGYSAKPTFVDLDGDGDLDAFIGEYNGDTLFFKNTGTAINPVFAAASTNPFGLSNAGIYANPAFVDIDGDSDLDALIGNQSGDTLFFRNTGTASNPVFAAASTNPFGLSDAGTFSSPTFVDIDADGDLDALVGNRDGNTLFFLNTPATDDVLLFSTAGDDTLTGTASLNDTVSYANATAAVTVSLEKTTQQNTNGAGRDTITKIENLIGSDFNDNLKGKSGVNQLNGGAGNDRLDGRGGADAMIGGFGNDIYNVNNAGDIITENPGEGTDKINSRVTYTLPDNVEDLTLKGAAAIDGIGNALNNKLIGNSAANQLNGGGGNDRLNGKAGADTLVGGLGDDIYTVDIADDIVIENFSQGRDTIKSTVTYTLPDNVEKLTLTGSSAIDGTGNSKGNTLTGNSAVNQLDGGAGIDKLDGKGGNNILTGGAGKDIFKFTTTGHIDTITDFDVPRDTIQLDNAVFTALTSTGTLAADQFVIGAAALDTNDFVIYDDTAGFLLYDADGSDAGAAVQIAVVGANLAMTNADIVVI